MPETKIGPLRASVALAAALLACAHAGAPSAAPARAAWVVDQNHPNAADQNAGTPEAPFKTVGRAVTVARAGDTVLVKAGVYREQVLLTESGSPDRPIIFRSAPGERVVVSGADAITGWRKCSREELRGNPNHHHIYCAELTWAPMRTFYQGNPDNLRRVPWPDDPSHLASTITAPGEHAIDTSRKPYRLYLWLPSEREPDDRSVEGTRRRFGIRGEGISGITVDGFEVARTYGNGISFSKGGTNNAVLNCVAYYCQQLPRMAAAFGISFEGQRGARIKNSISVLNGYGVNVAGCNQAVIEENLVGCNEVDAMIACWHTRDAVFARNYVFNNWDQRHPDGFQSYRDVQRLVLDSNLFLDVGQGWQCAETQDSFVTNNIWAGIHWPNSISCSLREPAVGDPNLRNVFVNNTFFSGNVSSGGESRFLHNIAIPPSFGGTSGGVPVESDHNLVWNYPKHVFQWSVRGQRRPQTGDFRAWQRAVTSNQNSKFADPRFLSAPVFQRAVAASPEPGAHAAGRLDFARNNVEGFRVGDLLEIDCDGVPRRITRVGQDHVIVDPPPGEPPRGGISFVWNWKANASLRLDFRLAEDSPGRGMGKGGVNVGSSIDVQAYMRGDLNGDGRRDVPPLPDELLRNRAVMKLLR